MGIEVANAPSTTPSLRDRRQHGAGHRRLLRRGHRHGGAAALVEHNIFVVQATQALAVLEYAVPAEPYHLRFNDLPGTAYWDRQSGCTGNADGDNNPQTCTVAEMEALTDMTASGNVANAPGLDSTAHLTNASPCAVTQSTAVAGDVSVYGYANDAAGTARTIPWSMGAFEHDGTCAP